MAGEAFREILGEGGNTLFTRLARQVANVMRVGCFYKTKLNAKRALCFLLECKAGALLCLEMQRGCFAFWKK